MLEMTFSVYIAHHALLDFLERCSSCQLSFRVEQVLLIMKTEHTSQLGFEMVS